MEASAEKDVEVGNGEEVDEKAAQPEESDFDEISVSDLFFPLKKA